MRHENESSKKWHGQTNKHKKRQTNTFVVKETCSDLYGVAPASKNNDKWTCFWEEENKLWNEGDISIS